jgi:hypothetical protein
MPIASTLSPAFAESLSQISGDLNQGTVVSIEVRKKGVVRGAACAKVVYDDDLVHVILWTGFSYKALVARSRAKLDALQAQDQFIQRLHREVLKVSPAATIEDVCAGYQEIENNMSKVLARADDDPLGLRPIPGQPTSVWTPLKLGGETIPRAQVYVGPGDPKNPHAPITGSVYLHGVKLGEKVLAPAPNGHWTVEHKPKTVTKNILRSWLPEGFYRSYVLEPERVLALRVAKAASEAAKLQGVPIDLEAVRSAFKIAP